MDLALQAQKTIMGGVELFFLTLMLTVRLGASTFVADGAEASHRPEKPLILYEYRACPFCRKVRETLSVLDLDVVIYPCPRESEKGTSRFRAQAKQVGGKTGFPLLVDENTGKVMYESSDIVAYLWKQYGNKAKQSLTFQLANSPVLQWTLFVAAMLRGWRGRVQSPSRKAQQPLVLYGFEGSPFTERVSERLCELEIQHKYINVAHGAQGKRKEFMKKHGHLVSSLRKTAGFIQVPLLEDPNTGKVLLESADIVDYLNDTYAL